jgi:protein TonB
MKLFFPQVTIASLFLSCFIFASAATAETPEATPATNKDALDNGVNIRELEAETNRRIQEYAQHPRRKYIHGTASEKRFRQYLETYWRKIECSARSNYPEAARGKTNSIIITVSILADGSLEETGIDRGSGNEAIDNGAMNIVRLAAPFDSFPPEIRHDTDMLVITQKWTFEFTDDAEKKDEVRTSWGERSESQHLHLPCFH